MGDLSCLSAPLARTQSHQVWVETGPQNTRGWVGQAVAVLVWGLLQELRYLWLQSVWLWARCLVPVGRLGKGVRQRLHQAQPSGSRTPHTLAPRILPLPVLLSGLLAQSGLRPSLAEFSFHPCLLLPSPAVSLKEGTPPLHQVKGLDSSLRPVWL